MAPSRHLSRKLQVALGSEAAEEVVAGMRENDSLSGEIVKSRHEMEVGFTNLRTDFKVDAANLDKKMDVTFATLDKKMDVTFATLDKKMDVTFAMLDKKMEVGFADMRTYLERSLKEQTRFFFLAWAALLASNIALWFR